MITYDNNIQIINDTLQDLIEAEFINVKVTQSPFFESENFTGTDYFRMWYSGDEWADENVSDGETRAYTFDASWYFNFTGNDYKNWLENHVGTRIDRLNRLFRNNYQYDTGGYKWNRLFIRSRELVLELEDETDVAAVNMVIEVWRTNTW